MVSLAMSGFGVDMMRGNRDSYAVKIDEHSVSHDAFYRERRDLEERYRMVFGKNFGELAKQLNLNMGQQTIDKVISDYLIEREATRLGLAVGPQEVSSVITTQIFGGKFDAAAYANFLRRIGMTSQAFEERVRLDALRQAFTAILRSASIASQTEARAALRRDETSFHVEYVEFDPAQVLTQVKEPSEEELQKYLDSNTTRFEQSERARFEYVALDPNKFLDLVKVSPEDVELYYTDNQSDFMRPEALKVRHVQLNYAKSASPQEMASVKEKAQQVQAKAAAGEPFESLVLQYSDDITTKALGGDLGWLNRGKMDKAFDAVVFKQKVAGLAPMVETDYGFHIVYVDAYREPAAKELAEVRAEIETLLKKQEAPAYTAEKAHELFEQWKKSDLSLSDFAKQHSLVAASTKGLLSQEADPEAGLKGLSAAVIDNPEEQKQLIDIGEKSVLVSILEFRPTEVPSLGQIKEKVKEAYRKEQAQQLAKTSANEFAKALSADGSKGIVSLAKAQKREVKTVKDLKKASAGNTSPFQSEAIQKAVFKQSGPARLADTFESAGKMYVLEVVGVTAPSEQLVQQKVSEAQKNESQELAQLLTASLNARLKAQSVIDVAPGLLAVEE
jgi:peptidyl-prolyl cis-trans isomerase D